MLRLRTAAATLLVLLVFVSLAPGAAAAGRARATEFDGSLATQLQSIIDAAQSDEPIVGVSAAVVLADGSRWESGAGLLEDGAASKPMLASTPSVLGSITKTFVTALILQLAEEGRLRLRNRLSRWFPEYPFASQVTVKQMLQHTSGMRDYFTHPAYAKKVYGRPTHYWTTDEILTLVRPNLLFAPGSSWSYSNTNFLFLGLIAEKVTGNPLAAELRSRFLGPLGLADTTFQGAEDPSSEPAFGYWWKQSFSKGFSDGTSYRPNTSAATVAWAAGGLLSSAHDVATWTRALYRGDLLSQASMHRVLAFNDANYGLGTRRFDVDGVEAWGHTGSLRGFTAVTWYMPDSGITVTVLTNRGRIRPEEIGADISRAVLDWLAAQPARAA